jgi:CMP-N-acetylneuraminic acid synthetase
VIYYVIPARKGSKGYPGKNRELFLYTYRQIPAGSRIIVPTDDDMIETMCLKDQIYWRVMDDLSSMKDVLLDCVAARKMKNDDIIVMLYCTYPGRKTEDITGALDFFNRHHGKSLLCRKEVKTNPHLCMYDHGLHGEQVIEHRKYRRQDYQRVFEISHYIAIIKVDELPNVNRNLYNQDTIYYPIDDVIDVDSEEDYENFMSLHLLN